MDFRGSQVPEIPNLGIWSSGSHIWPRVRKMGNSFPKFFEPSFWNPSFWNPSFVWEMDCEPHSTSSDEKLLSDNLYYQEFVKLLVSCGFALHIDWNLAFWGHFARHFDRMFFVCTICSFLCSLLTWELRVLWVHFFAVDFRISYHQMAPPLHLVHFFNIDRQSTSIQSPKTVLLLKFSYFS